MIAVTRLKIVWKFAMSPLEHILSHSSGNAPHAFKTVMRTIKRMVPMTLKTMWAMPVRLASLEEPMEQTMAVVTQVPRLIPMIMG